VIHKKRGSTFLIITLKNSFDFYNFSTAVSRNNIFALSWKTRSPHLSNVLTLPRYLVKMKHHISHFYNALLEHSPLHQACVWNIKFTKYREKKLTVTRSVQSVHHWHEHKHASSTVSSISDCSKPRHPFIRRCRSSSMSWTWHWRHIYVACKINK